MNSVKTIDLLDIKGSREVMVRRGFPPGLLSLSPSWITQERVEKGINQCIKNDLIVLCGDETEEKILYGGIMMYYFWMNSHQSFQYINCVNLEDGWYVSSNFKQLFLDDFDKTVGFKNKPKSEAMTSEVIRNGGRVLVNVYTIDKLLGCHGTEFIKRFGDRVALIECPRATEIKWKGVKL